MEWIVDDSWTQTYTNDYVGNNLNGSLNLVEAVLAGKIDLESYVAEANNLYKKDGHVNAKYLGQYSKTRAYDFPALLHMVPKLT